MARSEEKVGNMCYT